MCQMPDYAVICPERDMDQPESFTWNGAHTTRAHPRRGVWPAAWVAVLPSFVEVEIPRIPTWFAAIIDIEFTAPWITRQEQIALHMPREVTTYGKAGSIGSLIVDCLNSEGVASFQSE